MNRSRLAAGGFFAAQPDTPLKPAVFAYAFEHLEIAAYEMLKRVAQRAGDSKTDEVAHQIVSDETDAARMVQALFSAALDATLRAQPNVTRPDHTRPDGVLQSNLLESWTERP